jgi:hypothetical protein
MPVVALSQLTWQQRPPHLRPRAGAELFEVTHNRSCLSDDFVGADPSRRRLTHRSLRRERLLVARRYGRGL